MTTKTQPAPPPLECLPIPAQTKAVPTPPHPVGSAREASAREFIRKFQDGPVAHEFRQLPMVRDTIRVLATRGHLLVGALRREVSRSILKACAKNTGLVEDHKPSGLDVEDMANSNPHLFQAGPEQLPPAPISLSQKECYSGIAASAITVIGVQSLVAADYTRGATLRAFSPAWSGDGSLPSKLSTSTHPTR